MFINSLESSKGEVKLKEYPIKSGGGEKENSFFYSYLKFFIIIFI